MGYAPTMPAEEARSRTRRENRLLVITIAVSVVVLLVLARFRFPEQQRLIVPAPAPLPPLATLERLAAQATFDELASTVAQLETRLAPSIVVLRVRERRPPEFSLTPELLRAPDARPGYPRWVPAVRTSEDTALAWLEPDTRVQGVVGAVEGVPVVLGLDSLQGLAIVKVPPVAETRLEVWETGTTLDAPRYIAVVEGTRGGPRLRPLFVGRTDPISDPRWDRPLLDLGRLEAPAGSLLFSLDGRLIGLVVPEEGALAVAPTELLASTFNRLLTEHLTPPGDLGIEVQAMTPALATATGADHGAVVSYVTPGGPAEGELRVGDVIQALDGETIFSPERLIITVTRLPPGTAITLGVLRRGEPLEMSLEVVAEGSEPPGTPATEPGWVLRGVRGVGCEVLRLAPGQPASRAGLRPGDLITSAETATNPTVAQLGRAFRTARPGARLLLGVERAGRPLLLVLEKPEPPSDEPREPGDER